jgi:hypothetical protein
MWYDNGEIKPHYGKTKKINIAKNVSIAPSDLVWPASERDQQAFNLSFLLPENAKQQLRNHLLGMFGKDEPGNDSFSLDQVTEKNIYTSGLSLKPIKNARADILPLTRMKLTSFVVRPNEEVSPGVFRPQIRLIFQLVDEDGKTPLEQFFVHTVWRPFSDYSKFKHLSYIKHASEYQNSLFSMYPNRELINVTYSSTMTGIWVFGSIYKDEEGNWIPERIQRKGVDVGHYSTIWDGQIFRNKLKNRPELGVHLDKLIPQSYRDPGRSDPERIRFDEMTCAQCHHFSARDGVHISLNDGIDKRINAAIKVTEYLYSELERQLNLLKYQ